MIKSFEPIIDEKCRILILGTMPGEESLQKHEYYAYRRNQFWMIMFSLLGEEATENYESKKRILLNNQIAVWDVLEHCERESSSDSNIKNAVANDFNWLFKEYPNLKYVNFNGDKANKLYRRLVHKSIRRDDIIYSILPSTSPANTIKLEEKLNKWKIILTQLWSE